MIAPRIDTIPKTIHDSNGNRAALQTLRRLREQLRLTEDRRWVALATLEKVESNHGSLTASVKELVNHLETVWESEGRIEAFDPDRWTEHVTYVLNCLAAGDPDAVFL
jgi:hypothetical protein